MSFFVVTNANQSGNRFVDMADLYTESFDKQRRSVWGMVHLDFFHDVGLKDVAEKLTKEHGSGFPPIELEIVTKEELARLRERDARLEQLEQ